MSEVALPDGFRASGVHCGLKANGALDLGLLVADAPQKAYALFTQNELLGAHIPVCRANLERGKGLVRAILVNSGNANCATGETGQTDAEAVCAALAKQLACPPYQVLFLSTGVIGARLDTGKITAAIPDLVEAARHDGIADFARAIMTTDTHPKLAVGSIEGSDGDMVSVAGVAKGSGMIHPDMATMLAFLVTNGKSPADLAIGLRDLADRSFHCVTVDGDTSPNDSFVLWSSAEFWCRAVKDEHGMADVYPLEEELTRISQDLSRQIAKDGEGATRLITIEVEGCMSHRDAMDAGRFIATSPLVKTAVFGRDPNWGRILSAAASSGLPIDMARAGVRIGPHVLYAEGQPHPENEPAASALMQSSDEVILGVNMGMGPFATTVWTCDLTTDYITINADYRT